MDKKYWIYIVLEAIIFIFIIGTMAMCNNNKTKLLEHNLDTYKDTVNIVKLENQELLSYKKTFILTEKELRTELDISKQEIKNLEKKLNSNIAYIAKLEGQINIKDSIVFKTDTIYITNNFVTKNFYIKNDWLYMNAILSGSSIENSELTLDSINMLVPLDVGLTDDYKFWAKSKNPYLSITNINGGAVYKSEIAKKEKHFHHGIYLGFGINYGIINKVLDVGPSFGYCVVYTF